LAPSSPIAVLDSGLGGLTVVRALRSALPHERIVYFGDTARLPYGSKTAATVTTFVTQIIQHLLRYDPKHVVIACNTATALALNAVRAAFPNMPVSGVIEPGARAASAAAGAKEAPTIGVIATEATQRSKAYFHAIGRRRHHAKVLVQATPLLVPIIEEGRSLDDPLVRLALQQYLHPLMKHRMDVLVLGCTHYPVLKGLIAEIVGPKVPVIDSAEQCAEDVARRLQAAGMLSNGTTGGGGGAAAAAGPEALRCVVTDDPARFQRLARRFVGVEIPPPAWVSPDELYGTPLPAVGAGESEPLPVRRAV
jgi:glutamate racemase